MIDRESAYEKLSAGGFSTMGRAAEGEPSVPQQPTNQQGSGGGLMGGLNDLLFGSSGPRGGKRDGIVQTAAKSMARDLGRQIFARCFGVNYGGAQTLSGGPV